MGEKFICSKKNLYNNQRPKEEEEENGKGLSKKKPHSGLTIMIRKIRKQEEKQKPNNNKIIPNKKIQTIKSKIRKKKRKFLGTQRKIRD